VHISRLRDDIYSFDRRNWCLVGRRTGRTLRVGSTIEVRIAGVNIPRRELDLEPVEPARPAPTAAAKGRLAHKEEGKAARREGRKQKRDKGGGKRRRGR
jgi:ribonuclease R